MDLLLVEMVSNFAMILFRLISEILRASSNMIGIRFILSMLIAICFAAYFVPGFGMKVVASNEFEICFALYRKCKNRQTKLNP